MNMENPVAMPKGGTTIFRIETGLRVSRTRQTMTAARPASEPITAVPLGTNIFTTIIARASLRRPAFIDG
jgi:hypothetical protein